jgi:hypothetical protein
LFLKPLNRKSQRCYLFFICHHFTCPNVILTNPFFGSHCQSPNCLLQLVSVNTTIIIAINLIYFSFRSTHCALCNNFCRITNRLIGYLYITITGAPWANYFIFCRSFHLTSSLSHLLICLLFVLCLIQH